MKKINIGLDIGVASVGWSIIDEDNNLIDLGVRLFEDPANAKDGTLENEKRRSARSSRRRINRIRVRKNDLVKLITKFFDLNEIQVRDVLKIDNFTQYDCQDILDLKVKALKQKVSIEEIIHILFHYIHHRGYFYLTTETANEQSKNKVHIDLNRFPSDILKEKRDKDQWYKNSSESKAISAQHWLKEIKHFLKTQSLNESFIKQYLDLFNRMRNYAEGPGSEKSPTPYGLWRKDQDGNVQKVAENLWDLTVGKCSIYPKENRGGKTSPIAELFNLLNDINNIYFYDKYDLKITKEMKKSIFDEIKENWIKDKTKELSLEVIRKAFNDNYDNDFQISKDNSKTIISGFRGTSKKEKTSEESKPEFTKLVNFKVLWTFAYKNKLIDIDKSIYDIDNLKFINEIFIKLQKEQDVDKQLEIFKHYSKLEQSDKDLSEQFLSRLKSLTSTHSLSYKAMLEFVKFGINESVNQMVFFNDKIQSNYNEDPIFKDKKYMPVHIFNNEVISPTARRAFIQTTRVVNKIIKHYLKEDTQLSKITIEIPREKNSKEQREQIDKFNKENRNKIEKILKENGRQYSEDTVKQYSSNGKGWNIRLELWDEQNHCDIYTGEDIPIQDVLSGKNLEIDHIIPISICGIDAKYNKILTNNHNNANKSNMTPYQWLNVNAKSWEAFETRVKLNNKLSEDKKKFLLFKLDPMNDLEGFINRNLVDTRYASKVVLNNFQTFFRVNKQKYPDVTIAVIRGAATSFARKKSFFNILKDRDDYSHHAVDAMIINYLGNHRAILGQVNYAVKKQQERIEALKLTGEILAPREEMRSFYNLKSKDEKANKLREQFLEKYNSNNVKFSRQLRTSHNTSLSNETFYSIKWDDSSQSSGTIIEKLDLLANDKPGKQKLSKYFLLKSESKDSLADTLLIFNEDEKQKLFKKLKKIYDVYINKFPNDNPFISFMKEEGIENPTFVQVGEQKMRYLRYLGDKKQETNLIVLKNHNNNAVLQSLSALEFRIYKDENNKYVILPINQKVLSFHKGKLKIDDEKLQLQLQKIKVVNCQHITIKNGTIFIENITKKLLYSNGGGDFNNNTIELKCLTTSNELSFGKKRIRISIAVIAKNYNIAEVDELGNIYNEINIVNFFNEK